MLMTIKWINWPSGIISSRRTDIGKCKEEETDWEQAGEVPN